MNLLQQLKNVHCDGEILSHRIPFPRVHVDALCARSTTQVYGCKILSFQLCDLQPIPSGHDFLSRLFDDGYRIIYLKRDDVLRHAVSNIAARRFAFHQKKADSARRPNSIHIDPQELLLWMEGSLSLDDYERRVLRNIPHLQLTYERDLEHESDHQRTVDRICDFVGITTGEVRCEYRKSTPASLTEYIANYEELAETLEASPYAGFLPHTV